ncbi:hypothetical protein NCS57_00197300 [Fusarium keratoplasticum]|uniref:Uncharacterized protein n=1 Tax=Fusarium keratoplasticum TaxID=1328300 RepID=A0ACC0R9K7_9HYPO|nr:hypothetical protein NCS57_00197300 [Fusarium keratoplasticum]KAI8679201.1 hypothetical protein NCS57_00197300 [Fusarium keratoplasticum]
MAELPKYSPKQLAEYLDRIQLPASQHASDPLEFLTQLVQRQLVTVPFETLSLHYSTDKNVSLDPEHLHQKIVHKRRGGYCLENNSFFGTVLRSLGFHVIGVICRITMATRGVFDGSWRAMSHMANIVTIDSKKYLVDVGYGADGPCTPLPLDSGDIRDGLPSQQLKLEHRTLPQHLDSTQKVWVYSQKRGSEEWADIYHFPDVEFFPLDFDILNHHAMTKSLWASTVVAQRFTLDEGDLMISGTLLLVRDELKVGNSSPQKMRVVKKMENEEQRLDALKEHFSVSLTEEEQRAIRGSPVELGLAQ